MIYGGGAAGDLILEDALQLPAQRVAEHLLELVSAYPVDRSPYRMRDASAAEPRRKAIARASLKLIAPIGNARVNRTPATVNFLRHQ
ncbi:hypothetical protein LK533_08660 [Sphingomonas sp. PL-96]|uniref:hypothetical protein n=1 Tax=Sphingomonas sp. PL-96 TaxID=2887201 RepID=UPI001E372F83|nr:hypothetical protein [Sphingomonas sp. PL-96]MCC2976742.1 hypothetical protein [Sphingomonas sp. PL-96]